MKKLITFLMLFAVFGGSKMWADDNLLNENFTTWSTEEATTNGANTLTGNTNIVFYNASNSKHFKVTNGKGIELADNNLNNNYFIAIPLSGIRNTITVTITHEGVSEKTVTYDYILGDGETAYSTSTAGGTKSSISDAENGASSMTKTIDCTESNAVLYIGRHNSNGENKTPIKSITITTPSSGALTLAAARDYTWIFNDNNVPAASETATVLANGDYNFEIKNAAIETLSSSIDVKDLANGITKRVYFDGMGSTSNKYVHVKVQGPCKITAFGRSVSTEERYLIINCGGTQTEVKAGSSSGDVTSGSYFYTGTEEADVYIYSKNSGIHFFGLVVKPTLSQFEFNPDEVLYYKDNTTREFINSTTFEQNTTYDYLRLKLKIDPDYESLTNPSFSVTSSNAEVLDASEANVYKATDKRLYVDNIQVEGTGTATLTFTFNGAENYAGPMSFTQDFTVNPATPPTISMSTPATTTDVAVNTSIVLTTNRTVTAVGETISGKLGDSDITFTLTDGNTLTYTPASNLANATTYNVKINANQIQGTNGAKNTEETFSFTTVAAAGSLTAVSDKVWNFSDWANQQYTSGIVEGENIEVITSSAVSVDGSSKTFTDDDATAADNLGTLKFTKRFKTGGTSAGSNRLLHFKATKGTTIQIVALSQASAERTLYLCTDAYNITNNKVAELKVDGSALKKLKFTYTGDTDEDFYIGTSDGIGIYYIKVSSNKTSVSLRPGGNQKGSSETNPLAVNTTFNYSFVPTVSGGSITSLFPSAGDISPDLFEISSSDPSIIDVSGVTYSASSDDLSKGRFYANGLKTGATGGSANITLKYKGTDTYSEATTTFTLYVTGPVPFNLGLSDISVQNGQRAYIMPTITNEDGEHIGIEGTGEDMHIVVLDEDANIDYDQYFDFTYTMASNDAGLSLDATNNSTIVCAYDQSDSNVGKTATVTVTATPKAAYASLFSNSSTTSTLEVTVTQRTQVNYLKFYLDKEKTTQVTDVYSYTLDGSTSVFSDFPNGRIIYVDLNSAKLTEENETVDEIWFSYKVGSSTDVTRSSSGKNDYGKKQYLLNLSRGGMVPIHIDDVTTGDVYVNFLCYKKTSEGYASVGSVIKTKFSIVNHDRPAVVTYDPQSPDEDASLNTDGYKIRNTSQSVVAIGATGNDIFAKFSSKGTNYTIEGLLNEPNVVEGTEKVGVFSTEVAARKISGVQIHLYDDAPFVSSMTTMTYFYRYATTLTLSSNASQTIDLSAEPAQSVTEPTYTATYYDKVKKNNIDETNADNVEGTPRYSIVNIYGANATIDATTGEVTNSTEAGRSIVTITYDCDATYTVNKRTSRMDVATATYTIYWTKSGDHMPKIEPVSKNFYPTQEVKVTADKTWITYYTTDNSTPSATNGTAIAAGSSATFIVDATTTVKAVAYDGTSVYSTVISETYTKGEQVLPPYFVPDGTVTGGYKYYTETLDVEARTNTAGASVYYTTDGTEPVIGASNTYLYDGLSGITLTDGGTTTIKAIAVKDGIQSTVTTSTYVQSALDAPYFQKNGSGEYTSGSVDVTTTDNISIGSNANPGSYTLVYYYTLDGSEPTVENGIRATSSSTFNVVKTVDAKSIAVLVDGSGNIVSTSSVTKVRFNVTLDGNRSYVWEANNITTPNGHMGREDGFVISTETSLPLAKANASVHLKSLPATGQPITFAQQYITATFGGYEFGDWNHFTISDEALGTPIDGVGEFNIRSDKDNGTYPGDDALTEGGYMYSHIFTGQSTSYNGTYYTGKDASTSVAKPTTVHEKTFLLPVKGAYVKFEPERDGELTIWALQQGGIHYNEDAGLCDRFIRRRPVYFIDEQGKSYRAKKAESSARLSAHWNTIISGYASEGKNWFKGLGETQTAGGKTVTNNFYNEDESEAIYNMFLDYFMKRGDYATGYGSNVISVGDPIQPIPIHTASRTSNPITERGGNNSDNSTDMTGYVLASGGYVKYTFEVKAGKTYYFFGHATKIGIRGFQFVPSENDATVTARTQKTIAETGVTDAATAYGTDNAGTIKVKLNRTFNANTWAGLVLPFSVSETQMQKVFGAGTKVIHFSDVADTQINLVHHWYDMVVAGTPVLIYPTQTVSPTFDGVQVEGITSGVEKLGETNASSTYYMMGTYINLDAANGEKKNDYYITASTGAFKRLSSDNSAVKPTRVWLRPKDPNNAKALVVNIEDFFYGDTTGIISIEDDNSYKNSSANDNIYNLQGQKVGKGSTSNLQRGVYIVNGKKIVVK